mmetsp:Transcript_3122/g.6676  ORF Transcript_3122/g.6676 Transcript_3122/m.6676 type:complete len:135 (+) Transcript_3122:274-678(+)
MARWRLLLSCLLWKTCTRPAPTHKLCSDINRLTCAAQVAQRYRWKTKETGKKQNTVNGKRKASNSSLCLRSSKHFCSQSPAASTLAPVSASPVSVLDLNSLVHVPVIVGPECETDYVVGVEALPIYFLDRYTSA